MWSATSGEDHRVMFATTGSPAPHHHDTARHRSAHQGSTEPPAIRVEGLTKAYDDRQVLKGLTFEVTTQEIFGILGPNGVGKTTAVEIIQGLRRGDAGTIQILGLDPIRDQAKLRTVIGAQLQSSALPDRLRVGEALRLFARLAGDVVDWRELRDMWDLGRLQRSAFGSLSGGERQRLFVALALVNNPTVVFLDELTQGLDPASRRETWRLVRRVRDQGTTVVLVTHYMDEAEQLCDRVGVLHDGRITACDTPDGLIAGVSDGVRVRFSSPRTADLAGIEAITGVHHLSHDGTQVEITTDAASVVPVAGELARRGITPDDFTVVRPTLEDVFVSLTTGGSK
jgi:ABC-2 type transport system ATP-binding protein